MKKPKELWIEYTNSVESIKWWKNMEWKESKSIENK